MAYPLDTHTLLWFYAGEEKLPLQLRQLIENTNNECFVSIVSLWEVTIKLSIGKLSIDGGVEDLIAFIENNMIDVLPIQAQHLLRLLQLPHHHNDPFDRLIISQAQTDGLTILGVDEAFKSYDVLIMWR